MVTKPRGDPLSPRLNGPARCPIVALKRNSSVKSTLFLSTTVNENVKKLILTVLLLLAAPWVQAQLQIEIISGNASALPIAIVPFKWEEKDMADRPADEESIRFGTWRLLKVDYIVVGKVRTAADGGHELVYQLFD